jgi:signal recognition particle subunit SRP19|tara:strand:- start:537 stop:839 length:303 start_codon:yes stop_codon:yes gene_type:complete
MKDYEKQVIWLDYFNSSYSRSQGRRVSRNRSIKNPILSDLLEAAKRLNLNPASHEVIHPKRALINSGYISITKKNKKTLVLQDIAKMLTIVKGETKKSSK